MKKITIKKNKNIKNIEFVFPQSKGVYLIVGPNGVGKTTLLVCIDRICNKNAFARGFSASRSFGEVDQYAEAEITYDTDNPPTSLKFRKKSSRWAVSPKGHSNLLDNFGYTQTVFIRADSNRIDVPKEEIRRGNFVAADPDVKRNLNRIFEIDKFDRLKRLRIANGRGRHATFFYVIEERRGQYYSEKRFSTGEIALLRLVEKLNTVENDAIVLLDEAEMALHPRVQKKLYDYLVEVAQQKNLTIFISTHSVTMIKSADKNHIISIEETENGKYDAVCPCYPAKAIGNVDFIDNVIYDAVFFVEDDMARTLLKRMIQTCCEEDNRFKTITNCIVPVGGYKQTAELAINTKSQLLNRSVVCAVWDADVFTETIPNDEEIARFYNENRRFIFNLGCTPEVWMIEKLERMDVNIVNRIRTKFHTEPSIIVNSNEYRSCNSPKPRKRAKQKMDVVLEKLSVACGEPKEVVLNEFADILVSNAYTVGQIKAIVAPMLAG